MYKTISKKVVSLLISQEVVKKDDQEVYEYGFEVLISTFVSILFILIISIIAKQILLSVLFMLSFIVARLFCGGFHAKHHLSCLLTTITNYLIFLFALLTINQSLIKYVIILLAVLSFVLIFIFAPVENENNPHSDSEIKRFRKQSRLLILGYIVLSVVSLLSDTLIKEAFSLGFGIFSVSFSLLLAKAEKALEMYKNKK